MDKQEFYEVDGCTQFIPVKVIKTYENGVDVATYGGNTRFLVDEVYSFPKRDEPQKVVVSKFVAEWIDECKEKDFSISYALNRVPPCIDHHGFEYIFDQDLFARPWLDGYEAEQEKLYTVEIPDPNEINGVTYLFKNGNGNVTIGGNYYFDCVKDDEWKKEKNRQLTKKEICKDFRWAWDAGFYEEVTD